jgi:alpha-L-rhamnosidase
MPSERTVAPLKVAVDDAGPAWSDAGVICPWTIYEVYGDKQELARHYPAMCRFVEFCRNRSKADLLPPEHYHCYGDWLSINADTPKDVICTAYFAHSVQLTARAAEALGKTKDAEKWNALFQQIRIAFNRAYVDGDGQIQGDTQCGYALALAFDLLDEATSKSAADHLVANIHRTGHLSTGFVGARDLLPVLSKVGRDDIALMLLHNDTFPSWGFSIKQGATSIWERWDGWTPGHGFQNPGMNSFAHYSFGAVYQWMAEHLGGIQSDGPAYKKIIIEPTLDPKLGHARVGYHSIRGEIVASWTHSGLHVEIPANTTARVVLPGRLAEQMRVNGVKRDPSKTAGDKAVYPIGSGVYDFSWR